MLFLAMNFTWRLRPTLTKTPVCLTPSGRIYPALTTRRWWNESWL